MAGLQFNLDWIQLLHYIQITTYFLLWKNQCSLTRDKPHRDPTPTVSVLCSNNLDQFAERSLSKSNPVLISTENL